MEKNEIVGTERVNPRHLREKYQEWVGKRVVMGLTTYHYLCGQWESIDGDGQDAVFRIGGRELKVPLAHIDTIGEALSYQADFYK